VSGLGSKGKGARGAALLGFRTELKKVFEILFFLFQKH
jgi:hypothetical protein